MGNVYDKKKGGVQPFGGSYAGVERYEKKNGVISFYIKYKNLQNITTRDKVGDSPQMTKSKALNLLNAKKTELNELRKMKQNEIPDFYIPKKKKRNSNFMTVNDIAAMYLEEKADTKDFTNIKSKYDNHIKDHPIASKPIVMIDQDDIKAFIKDKENTYVAKNGTQRKRKKRPTRDKSGIIEYIETDEEHKKRQYKLSNSTVNAIYGLIVTMTNYAIEDEIYTGKNPFTKKHRPKVNNVTLKYLNDEETKLFLRQLKWQSEAFEVMDRYVYLIGLLAVTTGARMRTILSIKVGDVDYHNSIIKLENKKMDNEEYHLAIASAEIRDLLHKFSIGKKPDDPIFVSSRTGTQIYRYPRVMNKILNLTVNIHRQKKKRLALRDLRNSLASNLAIKGIPLSHIGKVLHHKSYRSTQRYAQLMPDVASSAIRDYAKVVEIGSEE